MSLFLKTCFTPETSTKDIFTESNTRLELALRLPGFGVAHNKHTRDTNRQFALA